MAGQVLQTVVSIGGRVDNSFGLIGDQLIGLGSHIDQVSQKLIDFGKDSVTIYAEYDDLMRTTQAVGEFTTAEMAELDKLNRQMARTTIYTNQQMAEAEVIMGQYGMDIAEIRAMLPDTLDLAMAGNIDVSESIDILYSALMSMGKGVDYCVIRDGDADVVPSEAAARYHTIQEGTCEGTIIGGNLCTLNLLQGTAYMPDIRDKVLFLEDDNIMGEYFCYEFDRNLESLLQVKGADTIRGIVFGRFDESCGLNEEMITDIIRDKVPANIPVVFGADFGHVFPMITFPVGGSVRIEAGKEKAEIVIKDH